LDCWIAGLLDCWMLVSAQSQAAAGMLLRQSLAKTPKILAPNGHNIF
jgi:hypothetical protein